MSGRRQEITNGPKLPIQMQKMVMIERLHKLQHVAKRLAWLFNKKRKKV